MAYIARRPVRFDRNYAVGEHIPDSVVDRKMAARLEDMGRIIRVDDDTVSGVRKKASSRKK